MVIIILFFRSHLLGGSSRSSRLAIMMKEVSTHTVSIQGVQKLAEKVRVVMFIICYYVLNQKLCFQIFLKCRLGLQEPLKGLSPLMLKLSILNNLYS